MSNELTMPPLWQQHYTHIFLALNSAAISARDHYINAPLPLAYQIKLQQITESLRDLEALDPRSTQADLDTYTQSKHIASDLLAPPFKIGDKAFCRHLRTTGEVIGIAFHADQPPQARLLTTNQGKLVYNWVHMKDLEPPLPKRGQARGQHDESGSSQTITKQSPHTPYPPAA